MKGDEDHQAPRGKDGHLTIGGGSDFFSNPMGGGGSTSTSGRKKEFKPKTVSIVDSNLWIPFGLISMGL